MSEPKKRTESGTCQLPNGCTLYWERNEVGGRNYTSDEIGGGVFVWDTALVDYGTLLVAMAIERELEMTESREARIVAAESSAVPSYPESKAIVDEFNGSYGYCRNDCLFVEKLRNGGLDDNRIAVVADALRSTCRECMNSERGC